MLSWVYQYNIRRVWGKIYVILGIPIQYQESMGKDLCYLGYTNTILGEYGARFMLSWVYQYNIRRVWVKIYVILGIPIQYQESMGKDLCYLGYTNTILGEYGARFMLSWVYQYNIRRVWVKIYVILGIPIQYQESMGKDLCYLGYTNTILGEYGERFMLSWVYQYNIFMSNLFIAYMCFV